MKKSIIFIMCVLINHINAQSNSNNSSNNYPCDVYVQDANLDKFVGVWIGNNNGKSITLNLKKTIINPKNLYPNINENKCFDAIYGFHKYTDNSIELENSLGFSDTTVYENNWTILGGIDASSINKINGTLNHKSKNKSVKYVIFYIDTTHLKIESFSNRAGIEILEPGKPPYDSSINLPSNLILTKQ